MKKILKLSLVITMLALMGGEAQAQGKNSPEYIRQLNIFKKAKYFNDPLISRQALYNMMELDPADGSLFDSLAYEYYSYRQYTSSLIVSLEALKRNGNNLPMLELKAICWEQIGDKSKALESFEALFLKNNASITLYKIGFLQLDLKRYAEAVTSADILIGKPDVSDIKITFTKADESTQEIPLKAAAYNLKGLIAEEQDNKEEAIIQFKEALKIAPDFEIVLNNLKE